MAAAPSESPPRPNACLLTENTHLLANAHNPFFRSASGRRWPAAAAARGGEARRLTRIDPRPPSTLSRTPPPLFLSLR